MIFRSGIAFCSVFFASLVIIVQKLMVNFCPGR